MLDGASAIQNQPFQRFRKKVLRLDGGCLHVVEHGQINGAARDAFLHGFARPQPNIDVNVGMNLGQTPQQARHKSYAKIMGRGQTKTSCKRRPVKESKSFVIQAQNATSLSKQCLALAGQRNMACIPIQQTRAHEFFELADLETDS